MNETDPVGIKRIVHFNLICSDIKKTLEFYVDLLGGHLLGKVDKETIIKRRVESEGVGIALGLGDTAEYKGWVIRWGYDKRATLLDILQWTKPPSTGKSYDRINHIGITRFSLEVDDVDKAYKYLKSKGVNFLSPPQVADLTPENPGKDMIKIATALDPDGIFVQLEEFIIPE
jgi:catechol 2,3-dioxygenase-like lactoylglutathione lyase family enzyme